MQRHTGQWENRLKQGKKYANFPTPRKEQCRPFLTGAALSALLGVPTSWFSIPFLGLADRSRGVCSSSSVEVPEKVGGEVKGGTARKARGD